MVGKDTIETKKNARRQLMQSARIARRDGWSRDAWENHPDIREMSSKYDLHPDILLHISAWVWTYRR